MKIIGILIALLLSTTLVIAWAGQENRGNGKLNDASGVNTSSPIADMQALQNYMKDMQKTMNQMLKERSEKQRTQLIVNHMNKMKEGMKLMGSMMNMIDDQNTTTSPKLMMQQHKNMDQRMDIMQSMMQHMLNQQSMLMRDRNIIMRDRNLLK